MRGVAARSEDEGDAVADRDVGDIGADGFDNAGAFEPERQRQVAFVKSTTQLRVEQIDAGGLHGDQNLAFSGHGQRQILDHHRFGTAAGVNANRFHRARSELFGAIGCTG